MFIMNSLVLIAFASLQVQEPHFAQVGNLDLSTLRPGREPVLQEGGDLDLNTLRSSREQQVLQEDGKQGLNSEKHEQVKDLAKADPVLKESIKLQSTILELPKKTKAQDGLFFSGKVSYTMAGGKPLTPEQYSQYLQTQIKAMTGNSHSTDFVFRPEYRNNVDAQIEALEKTYKRQEPKFINQAIKLEQSIIKSQAEIRDTPVDFAKLKRNPAELKKALTDANKRFTTLASESIKLKTEIVIMQSALDKALNKPSEPRNLNAMTVGELQKLHDGTTTQLKEHIDIINGKNAKNLGIEPKDLAKGNTNQLIKTLDHVNNQRATHKDIKEATVRQPLREARQVVTEIRQLNEFATSINKKLDIKDRVQIESPNFNANELKTSTQVLDKLEELNKLKESTKQILDAKRAELIKKYPEDKSAINRLFAENQLKSPQSSSSLSDGRSIASQGSIRSISSMHSRFKEYLAQRAVQKQEYKLRKMGQQSPFEFYADVVGRENRIAALKQARDAIKIQYHSSKASHLSSKSSERPVSEMKPHLK